MTSQAGRVPDAIGALVQGELDDHPAAERAAYGRLILAALRRDGWVVVAPTGRATTAAVGRAPDGRSNPHSVQNGSRGR